MAGAGHLAYTGDLPEARRVDSAGGYVERHGFQDIGGTNVFLSHHEPLGSSRGIVLFCSPILNDFVINYRREVLLARRLACAGISAVRFHYRGTGHSGGKVSSLSFDSMVEDARAVLSTTGGGSPVGLLGTRVGALVAATISGEIPGAPLALWEPTLDGRAYFREAFRAAMTRRAKGGPGMSQADYLAALDGDGPVDLLGHGVYGVLHASLKDRALNECMGSRRGPILLVQLTRGEALGAAYQKATQAWRRQGLDVESSQVPVQQLWWFEEVSRPPERVIDRTVEWMDTALVQGVAA